MSEPFFKGLGVVYVEVEDGSGGTGKCDLCRYARHHPPPEYEDQEARKKDEGRWGVLHDCMDDVTLCKEAEEENQHAFHVKCIRAFVLGNKNLFRNKSGCPVCEKTIPDLSKAGIAAAAKKKADAAAGKTAGAGAAGAGAGANEEKKSSGDDDAFGDDTEVDAVGQTGGKKRKRDKQMYSVWVHVRQATNMKLVESDKTMNPVAYVNVFGKTVATKKGDGGKTFNCVWNEAFSFQKLMDEEEFSKESIQIRVEDASLLFRNTLIGFVKFQAETVHAQPNHEFYQLDYPMMNLSSHKKAAAGNVTMQGQLEVSVCVISEQDVKDDPTLPRHIYDAEVEMWAELQQKAEGQSHMRSAVSFFVSPLFAHHVSHSTVLLSAFCLPACSNGFQHRSKLSQ